MCLYREKIGTLGVGVGLYLCKHLATALEATLSFTSELGKGSTFTISFDKKSQRRAK